MKLVDEAGSQSRSLAVQQIRQNPLITVVGDNLDIRVKVNHQTSDSQHKDLHYFTSMIVFPRIVHTQMENSPPALDLEGISCQSFLLSPVEEMHLFDAYTVILGRILLALCPVHFQWMEDLLPEHIPHNYSEHMARKSTVLGLPMQLKNEAELADCIDIMDGYVDQLGEIYTEALGTNLLCLRYDLFNLVGRWSHVEMPLCITLRFSLQPVIS